MCYGGEPEILMLKFFPFFLLLAAQVARADLYSNTYAKAGIDGFCLPGGGCTHDTISGDPGVWNGTLAVAYDSQSITDSNGVTHTYSAYARAQASAQYGRLFVEVHADSGDAGYASAYAEARFSDTLIISGGDGVGHLAYVIQTSGPATYTLPLIFTYGVPFTISARVTESAYGASGYPLSSFEIDSISVTDPPGVPYTVTAASGTNYPVPEPSSLLLFATAAALGFLRIRHRSAPSRR
jgi:hypothetical protein